MHPHHELGTPDRAAFWNSTTTRDWVAQSPNHPCGTSKSQRDGPMIAQGAAPAEPRCAGAEPWVRHRKHDVPETPKAWPEMFGVGVAPSRMSRAHVVHRATPERLPGQTLPCCSVR